ncbi:MAG: glycosyltransferase [Gammaproteobacteria bacterium]
MSLEDIVLLSTADWDNPFWTNKQHVAVQLAERGHRVFYINSLGIRRPSASRQDLGRIARRLRKALRRPRQVRDRLWVWSPVLLPMRSSRTILGLNAALLGRWLGSQLRRLGLRPDVLWTYNPLSTQLLDLDTYTKVVYHCVDEIKAQPGMPSAQLERGERELVERADRVFVTAPKLFESRRQWNPQTHYFPNVADFDHFQKALDPETSLPDDLIPIPGPRLGFIGAISGYKVDFRLLRLVAETRPDWSLVLIGKVGEGEPWTDASLLGGLSNVHLLGPRPYAELPRYLKGLDVALLPNTLNDYTDHMFPMKFFEYLAAGRPVVSVDLPALRDYRQVASITASPQAFLHAIEAVLAGQRPSLEDCLAVARQHTYAARTEKMLKIVRAV